MKNLRLLFLSLCFVFFSSVITAQEVDISKASESTLKIAKHNAKKWKDKLMLSVNQTKFMEERMTAFEMTKTEIYKADTDMETKNEDLAKISTELHDGMHEILTPEQYEKYRADIKEISGK